MAKALELVAGIVDDVAGIDHLNLKIMIEEILISRFMVTEVDL